MVLDVILKSPLTSSSNVVCLWGCEDGDGDGDGDGDDDDNDDDDDEDGLSFGGSPTDPSALLDNKPIPLLLWMTPFFISPIP